MKWADEISVDPAKWMAEARLHVSGEADYLADHFPAWPTLPGALMLEAAAQAASALWRALCHEGERAFSSYLERLEQLRITRRVAPGETFIARVILKGLSDGAADFEAQGMVANERCMRARFRLRDAASEGVQRRGDSNRSIEVQR